MFAIEPCRGPGRGHTHRGRRILETIQWPGVSSLQTTIPVQKALGLFVPEPLFDRPGLGVRERLFDGVT
jgi:hypothetical protein